MLQGQLYLLSGVDDPEPGCEPAILAPVLPPLLLRRLTPLGAAAAGPPPPTAREAPVGVVSPDTDRKPRGASSANGLRNSADGGAAG